MSSLCVASCFLVVPFSRLMCELIASQVVCLLFGRVSGFKYWSHEVRILWDLCVLGFGSFLCSWDFGRNRLVLSVDSASSRLLFVRW